VVVCRDPLRQKGETVSGAVVLPEWPDGAEDFEAGVAWATGFFDIAQNINVGLDAGQQVILAGIVKRLDQLDKELNRDLDTEDDA
jgi:hypothetical protein